LSKRPEHVLLVEDSEPVSDALRLLIETTGARASVAASIAEALGIGARDPAKLVLIDLTLPDGDGLSLIEPLKAAGSQRFVALTGRDDPETRDRCRAAGCSEVLVKPIPARELVTRISAWLAQTA